MENDIHFKVGEMRLEQLTRSITDLERKHLNQVKENKDINSLSDFSTHADNTSKLWSGYVNALLEKKCNLSKEQQEAIECVNEMIKDINITLHGTYDDPLSREPQAKATSSF